MSNSELLADLGDPADWAEKQEELLSWTGSAFLAGETHPSDADDKARLYSWLCGLIGYLETAYQVAAADRTQLDELRAENERLKSLVERAYKEGHNCGRADPVVYQSADQDWQQSRARKALGGTNAPE